MIKKLVLIFAAICVCFLLAAALPIGTERDPVYTDSSGHVLNTPLIISNQVIMVPDPTVSNHIARLMDVTNINASTFPVIPITKGGTGTNSTVLNGAWTNSGNFNVTGTNNAGAYKVGGVAGVSCTITNIGVGGATTNYFIFGSGILTNAF